MFMDNNLDNMILASGMTKTRVAEEKGITAQNLSRVIHGKTKLSLTDAEEYAKILNCHPQQIMFKADPVPIIGYVRYDINMVDTYDFFEYSKEHKGWRRPAGTRNKEALDQQFPGGIVYLPSVHPFAVGAVLFHLHEDYQGHWYEYNGAMTLLALDPIAQNYVCKNSIQKPGYVKTKDGEVAYGNIYPEPGSTHTIHNPWRQDLLQAAEGREIRRGVKLQWATPAISTFWQPELRGVQTIFNK